MKKTLSIIVFMMAAGALLAQAQENPNTCYDCHSMMGPPYDSIAVAQSKDVHGKNDIQCVDCHGGDPTSMDYEVSMSPDAGFIGAPSPADIPELCGSCHADPEFMKKYDPAFPTDQLSKYRTSQHGELLAQGDEKVAECASCHGAHGIFPVDDPRAQVYATNVPKTCNQCHGNSEYMAEYNIPTDQFELFSKSVHGRALLQDKDTGAPACNDCHGNHGATPPGVTSISRVCGTCHANNFKLFQESVHKEIFDQMDLPECETCHGNHDVEHPTDELIGTGEQSKCMMCHVEGDTGYKVAAEMAASIDSLKAVYDSAQVMIHRAEQKDMNVGDLQFNLREVRQKLILTRTTIHSFDPEKVENIEQEGLSVGQKIIQSARELIHEYYYRRRGLGAFTLIITLLVVVLFFKIRQIDKRDS